MRLRGKDMESYDALHQCIGRFTKEVAKRLHKSSILIYKWQEPSTDFSESGSINPLDLIEATVDEAQRLGQGGAALAPIHWLNQRFNLVSIPLGASGGHRDINDSLIKSIKEFADTAQAVSEALADGRISPDEARRIHKEGWEAVQAITALIYRVEFQIKEGLKGGNS